MEQMQKDDWYTVRNVNSIDSPALLIYPDRIRKNIKELIRTVGNPDRLCPHIKTHKMREVLEIEKEEGINRFKCATIAEAELLGTVRAEKVLMAYQLNKAKARRFIELIGKYPDTHYSSLVDNVASAEMLNALFSETNKKGSVFIDIDNGMHRTGIAPGKEAVDLYQMINEMSNLTCDGLHIYDGHIHDQTFESRKEHCEADFAAVRKMIVELEALTSDKPIIIAGGSPTFTIHSKDPNIICSPGTNILWDKGYGDWLTEQDFLYAGILLTRIISKPVEGTITTDLGYKSISAENPIEKRIYFLNLKDYQVFSQSEEHLEVRVSKTHWKQLQVGEVLYGVPHHICPTVAEYDEAQVVENGKVTQQWEIEARRKKITI